MLRRPLACSILVLILSLASAAMAQEDKSTPQEPAPEAPTPPAPHHCPCIPVYSVELRAGGWWIGSFDAQTPAGRRRIDSSLFFDAGVDVEVERYRWTLSLSGDYGAATDVHVVAGSVRVGRVFPIGSEAAPMDVRLSAGPLFGSLDADVSGFGDFKSALGVEARAAMTVRLQEHVSLDFWAAFRQLSFKYDEAVTSGDTHAGGSGIAVGLGLMMRF